MIAVYMSDDEKLEHVPFRGQCGNTLSEDTVVFTNTAVNQYSAYSCRPIAILNPQSVALTRG